MKHLQQYPALFLFTFLLYASVTGHTIATSIVVIALTALSAYRLFLDSKEVPDYSAENKKEMQALIKRIADREEDVQRMKDDFGKMSLSTSKGIGNGQAIRF